MTMTAACKATRTRHWQAAMMLGCVLLMVAPVTAQWTRWGGPGGDFKAASTGLALQWPETGPKTLWSRDLGDGYSSILVEGDRLFTMYRANDLETVIALDAKNGSTIWEHKYDSSPSPRHAKEFGEGPRSTPLLSGNHLYTIGVSGVMHCLDKQNGKVVWMRDLWEEFDGNVLQHGYSSSPVEYNNTIIVPVGGRGAGFVALDKSDGHTIWKNLDLKNGYSTPIVIELEGKAHLVSFMSKGLVGMNPEDGSLEWQLDVGGTNMSQPVWDEKDGILFYSSLGHGAAGLKLSRKDDGVDVEEIWSTKKIRFYHVTSVHIDEYVYGSSGSGAGSLFAAINMKTGKIAWRQRGFAKATCLLADGRLIILDENGQLALATVTPEGFKVHSKFLLFDSESVSWTVPTVVGTHLYVRNKSKILALNLG